jgi:hypothetical protein
VNTYAYGDSLFGTYGMTGTLVVKSAQVPVVERMTLLAPRWLPTGQFQCLVSNLVAGANYVIQISTNLVDWSSLSTNSASGSVQPFTDNPPPGTKVRFYRAMYQP